MKNKKGIALLTAAVLSLGCGFYHQGGFMTVQAEPDIDSVCDVIEEVPLPGGESTVTDDACIQRADDIVEKESSNLGAADVTMSELNVNGTDILKAPDHKVKCGSGEAYWDQDHKILYLDNAEITQGTPSSPNGIWARYGNDPRGRCALSIVLKGENQIKGSVEIGIKTIGELELSGDGKLLCFSDAGIFAGECTIKDTSVSLTYSDSNSGNPGIEVAPSTYYPNIDFQKSGLSCERSSIEIMGYKYGFLVNSNEISIKDSSVKVMSTSTGISGGDSGKDCVMDGVTFDIQSDGAAVTGTNMTLRNCQGKLLSSGKNGIFSGTYLEIIDSDFLEIRGAYPALHVQNDLTISGSEISAVSTANRGIYSIAGILNFTASSIYAKGATGYPAVAADYKKQNDAGEPPVRIILDSGYEEIHGGRITASDWGDVIWNGSGYDPGSITSFVVKGQRLNEVTIRKKQYTPVNTVTFNSQGGTFVYPMAVAAGGTIYRPEDPSREGFRFTGWYKDPELTQPWDFEKDTVLGNLDLYAGWEEETKEYTVTFDSRGGTQTEPATGITQGSLLEKPADPQREFYIFTGWYRNQECTQAWDFLRDTVTSNEILYAGWKPYTPEAPVIIRVNTSTTAAKITWKKIPKVTGYVVYGYTGDAFARGLGNYDSRTIVRRASSTSCLEENLKPGTQRTYMVKAYKNLEGTNYYSKASKQWDTAAKPVTAQIKSITPMKGAAYVRLKAKAKGARGYAYCASTDGKKYYIVAKELKEPYKMKGLKQGLNYIKVRSYAQDIQGRTVYGNWSKVYKVQVL